MGSVIPDPVLEEESGDTAGPPSAPREGDKLEPDPVEPGEVVGTPVNCNEEKWLEWGVTTLVMWRCDSAVLHEQEFNPTRENSPLAAPVPTLIRQC